MTAAGPTRLIGFVYGERLEGPQRRSLGFQLLTPTAAPWADEIETLARALQTAPYPEHWPTTELFCSVLLPDGRRLVALARYGLTDQTPGRRRGGVELIGIVGLQAALGVATARAIYEWLKKQDRDRIGGEHDLASILAEAPPPGPAGPAAPVLPIRLWQSGALVFSAAAPGEPDQRLALLADATGTDWQWLPLIGPDFPLAEHARRGPLVAWVPQQIGVALKLEAPAAAAPVLAPPVRPSRWPGLLIGCVVIVLLVVVLAMLLDVRRKLATPAPVVPSAAPQVERQQPQSEAPPAQSTDRLALALYQYLNERGELPAADSPQLQRRYEELAAHDSRLRVADPRGQQALGQLARLADRGPAQVERAIRAALANRGFDPKLVDLVVERVRQHLQEGPP